MRKLVYILIALCIISCDYKFTNNNDTNTAKDSVYVKDTVKTEPEKLGKYIYQDEHNIIHVDLFCCYSLGKEEEIITVGVKRIETRTLTDKILDHYMCPFCLEDEHYDAILEIVNRNKSGKKPPFWK